MKNYIPIMFFFCIILSEKTGFCQDLLISSDNDSINCKVQKIENNTVYFSFYFQKNYTKTMLGKDKVKDIIYNYYVPKTAAYEGTNRFRAGCYIGVGNHFLRAIPDNFTELGKSHYKKLKTGINVGFEASYYLKNNKTGIGINEDILNSKDGIDNVTATLTNGKKLTGDMMEKVFINYLGLSLNRRFKAKSFNIVPYGTILLGMFYYQDNMTWGSEKFKLLGITPGIGVNYNYDLIIGNHTAANIKLEILFGTLKRAYSESSDGSGFGKLDKEEYIKLSRINLTIGINWLY